MRCNIRGALAFCILVLILPAAALAAFVLSLRAAGPGFRGACLLLFVLPPLVTALLVLRAARGGEPRFVRETLRIWFAWSRPLSYALLLLLCVVPVALVVGNSFLSDSGGLTLRHYDDAFSKPAVPKAIEESFLIAGGATLFALLLGVPYALFSARIRTPGRSIFSALYVLPLVLPPLIMAMGWSQFLEGARESLGVADLDQLLSGVKGAAFLLGLSYFPFVTLFARKAFLEIGAGFEEAARIRMGPVRAFMKITLPLATPAVLAGTLFVFLFSISDFAVVDYLSFLKGLDETVGTYAFLQFGAWKSTPSMGTRTAEALGTPMVAFSLLLLLLILWLWRKGSRASITSGHVEPGFLEEHGRRGTRLLLRGGGFLFMSLVLMLSVGIPVLRLVQDAMGDDGRIVAHIRRALGSVGAEAGNGLPNLLDSLKFAAEAAALMTLVAVILAHHAVRRGPRREALVMCLAFLPLAIGGIGFGAGLIRTWNHASLEVDRFNYIYETEAILVLMLAGKYLPFALAAISSSLGRVDPGLEEVAAVAGIRPARRLFRVVAPLSARGIAAGFVLGFVFSLRELDTMSILIPGDDSLIKKIYQYVHWGVGTREACLSLVLIAVIAIPFMLYSLIAAKRMRL